MAITLQINGTKVKVENKAVEDAFAQAISEAPAERGVLVSLGSPAISKIAKEAGLGTVEYTGVGNATHLVYPGALIDRVAAILGGASLVGSYRSDPIEQAALANRVAEIETANARAEAEDLARRQALPTIYGSRGWKNDRPCSCGKCGSAIERFEGIDCDSRKPGDIRATGHATLCRDCFAGVGGGASPFYYHSPEAKPAVEDSLSQLEESAAATARRESSREQG